MHTALKANQLHRDRDLVIRRANDEIKDLFENWTPVNETGKDLENNYLWD